MEPTIDLFLQYGSMGLLAFIVFWAMWKFLPQALETHKETISKLATDHKEGIAVLTKAFAEESNECREERREAVKILTELQKAVIELQKK